MTRANPFAAVPCCAECGNALPEGYGYVLCESCVALFVKLAGHFGLETTSSNADARDEPMRHLIYVKERGGHWLDREERTLCHVPAGANCWCGDVIGVAEDLFDLPLGQPTCQRCGCAWTELKRRRSEWPES